MVESIQRGLLFAAVAGATALFVVTCGGKVVVDEGGAGGSGVGGSQQSSTSVDVGNEGPGPGPAQGVGGSSGECRTCAEYITDAADQQTLEPSGAPLCQPDSQSIWNVLLGCSCASCTSECPPEACPGGFGSRDACGPCLSNTFTNECGAEFGDCANDAP
jgi:hypothetical protein